MPQMPSPYTSVAPGLGGQAQPLDPRLMQLAMQAIPGMGASQGPDPSPVPPSRQVTPPINDPMASGQSGPPSYGALPQQPGQDPGAIPDRVQQVVQLLMNPSMRPNPEMLMLMAGIGASVLFDNMGKPPMSKPHRSNDELASQGMDVGNPGQTGLPNERQMTQSLNVPTPRA